MIETQELLVGLRILVVEDELLIALDIEDALQRLRCEVIGPAATITEAMSFIAGADRLDGALLDMNVQGEPILPVIEALGQRAVPFILMTGYARRDSDGPALRDAPRLLKPVRSKALTDSMSENFLA